VLCRLRFLVMAAPLPSDDSTISGLNTVQRASRACGYRDRGRTKGGR
jgi:hypothetical protein